MSIVDAALKVLKDNKLDVDTFQVDLLNNRKPNPTTLGGFVYKSVGHVNLFLLAKKEGADDSTYVEINFLSDH